MAEAEAITSKCSEEETVSEERCEGSTHLESGDSSEQSTEEAEEVTSQRPSRRRPKIILNPDGTKPKLRTSKDLYDRLKWDGSIEINHEDSQQTLDQSDIYIGYKDRFLGICEIHFQDFEPGGEIPFHRIYYFRTGGPALDPFIGEGGEVKVREDNLPKCSIFIWDRDTRTDLVFKSGNSTYLKST